MAILRFYIRLLLFWLLWFVLCRLVFICYNYPAFKGIDFSEILRSFVYGTRLDLSTAGYAMAIPLLMMLLSGLFKFKPSPLILNIYHYIILTLSAFITIADCELQRKWGSKINGQVFVYISHPREMMLSSASSPVLLLFGIMAIMMMIGVIAYHKCSVGVLPEKGSRIKYFLSSIGLYALTFLMIRGNLGVTAINQSMASFSNKSILNAAAINSTWNCLYYMFSDNGKVNAEAYTHMPQAEADTIVKALYAAPDSTVSILNTQRPNIVVILLESWTASAIQSVSGLNNLTPNFDKLTQESLLFDSAYASGNRTEKGLVAVLSGFPAQPTTSIITEPGKIRKLPCLSEDLKKLGYQSSFLYGGEAEFANMKAYILEKGFDRIIDKNDFKSSQLNSKWGAHDGFVFEKALELYNSSRQPFFSTIMTLSSHEPFEVPMPVQVKGDDDVSKFKNSLIYSDRCLGDFIEKAKQQGWYHNTLFVLVADHGHEIGIHDIHFFDPVNFRIPIMLTGGALKQAYRGMRIHNIASQTDIAATLLKQLGQPVSAYPFSANLCNIKRKGFAQFAYSDGFGFTDADAELLYDNPSAHCYYYKARSNTADSAKTLLKAKAYQQKLISEYLKN